MTTADVTDDATTVERTSRIIGRVVWAVAVMVMIFGIPLAYKLLTSHGVPPATAWLLSIATDGALIVGLVATPVLAKHGVSAGWVGTLRWVAGLATWAMQTADPWTRPTGVDWIGVFTHSIGPVLLFFVVEAAAYFQRRMGEVIRRLRADTDAARHKAADTNAVIADLHARLNTATAERDQHLREAEMYRAEATSSATSIAEMEARLHAAQTETETALEAMRAEHTEALRRLRAQHAEKLAEAGTVKLSDYRRPASGSTTKTARRPRVSDDEAVAKCLDSDPDLRRSWTQSEVVAASGCGWGRAPRLLELLTEEQRRRASEAREAIG